MKPSTARWIFLFFLLGASAALGIGGWLLLRPASPPTLASAGGTVLVYEIDARADLTKDYTAAAMGDAMQRRIDPSRVRGLSVRQVGENRFEVGIPRSPRHDNDLERVKQLLAQTGELELRILANQEDDEEALQAAGEYIELATSAQRVEEERKPRRELLATAAREGQPPEMPPGPHDGAHQSRKGKFKYAWVELSRQELVSLALDNASGEDTSAKGDLWHRAATYRTTGRCMRLESMGQTLLYSRECQNQRLAPADRAAKRFDYFVLTRLANPGETVTGRYLESANETVDQMLQPAVAFRLNSRGGDLLYDVSSLNLPSGTADSRFYCHMAIILDGEVMTAPRLTSAIRQDGIITGNFTKAEVGRLADILRAGALPAPLKPVPISETIVEPQK